jgi:hypothetical protein
VKCKNVKKKKKRKHILKKEKISEAKNLPKTIIRRPLGLSNEDQL